MAPDTTLSAQGLTSHIRPFLSGGPQVGLYGSPSTVTDTDNWIANLPADEVFAEDLSSLLCERLIDAKNAHELRPFQTPLYERHVRQTLSHSGRSRLQQQLPGRIRN